MDIADDLSIANTADSGRFSKPDDDAKSSVGRISDDDDDVPPTVLEQITCKREMFQDATYELRLLEEDHARRVAYRKQVLRSWPPWRRRLYSHIKPGSWFERIVFVVILVNCITISTDNFSSISEYTSTIQAVEDACTFIFLVEMGLKMVGLGVFMRRDGYFSSWWNCLDFVIVMVGVSFFIVREADPTLESSSVSVARAFRVLRPFRTLSALGSLRTILRSIGSSLLRLSHVLTLSVIFTVVAGLIALQFFHGALSHRCYTLQYNPVNYTVGLEFDDDSARVCSTSFLPFNLSAMYQRSMPPPAVTALSWGPSCCAPPPANLTNASSWVPAAYCPGGPGTTAAGVIGFNGSNIIPFSSFSSISDCQLTFPHVSTSDMRANVGGVGNWLSREYIQFSRYPPPGTGLPAVLTGAAAAEYVAAMGMVDVRNRIRAGIADGFVKEYLRDMPGNRQGHVCGFGSLCLAAPNPDGGKINFDYILAALVTLYTILSLEGWSQVMYYTIDALGTSVAWYFVLMVLVGAVVVLNLALTILTDAFSRSVAVEEELDRRMAEGLMAEDTNHPDAFVDVTVDRRGLTIKTVEDSDAHLRNAKSRAASTINAIKEGSIYRRVQEVRAELHARIIKAPWLNHGMAALGMANLVILATVYEGASQSHVDGAVVAGKIITCLFCLEAAIVTCCTPLDRFSRSSNVAMKVLLGVCATVEWFAAGQGAVSAFYALRVLYLLRRLKRLRVTLRYLYTAMKATVSLVVLLLILVFLFALIGMQIFAGKACGLDTTSTLQCDTSICAGVPRTNFDNIGYGVVTVFIIVAGDGWRDIMNMYMNAVGDYAAIYFCLCYLLGGYIVINLFVAVLFSFGAEEEQLTILQQESGDPPDEDEGPGLGGVSEWLDETRQPRLSLSEADMLPPLPEAVAASVDEVEMEERSPAQPTRRRGESRVRIVNDPEAPCPGEPPLSITPRKRSKSTKSSKSIGGLLGHKQSMKSLLAVKGRRRTGSDASNRSRLSAAPADTTPATGEGQQVTHFLNRHKDRFRKTKSSNMLARKESAGPAGFGVGLRRVQSKPFLKVDIPTDFTDLTPADQNNGDGDDDLERTRGGTALQRNKSRRGFNRVTAFGVQDGGNATLVTKQTEDEDAKKAALSPKTDVKESAAAAASRLVRKGAMRMGTVLKSLEEFTRVEDTGLPLGGDDSSTRPRLSTQRTSLQSANHLDSSLMLYRTPSEGILGDSAAPGARSPASPGSPRRRGPTMFAERNIEDANVDRMAGAGKAGGMNDAYYFAYLRQRLQDQGLGRLATLLTQFHHLCGLIVTSRPFSWFMLTVVLYAMINLAMYDPLAYPDSSRAAFDRWTDLLSGILFFLEALLKIGYVGLYTTQREREAVRRPDAYFNNMWNALDFCLMVVGIVPAIGFFYKPNTRFASTVSTMRVARALRPLSFIGRHQGLRIIFTSLLNAIPAIGNISVFTVLVWCMFSVSAMQMLSGRLKACSSQDSWGDATYGPLKLVTPESCLAAGYEWRNPDTNYDNFGNSLLTMFMVATVDNWHPVMFQAADTHVEKGVTPTPNHRPYMVVFFIAYVVIMNFFLINFFVSVMVDTYFITKAQMELVLREFYQEKLLSPEQADFVKLYRRALIFVKPPLHVTIKAGTLRHLLRRVARSRNFEYAFLFLAATQTVLLATRFAEEPPMSYDTLFYVDIGFTGAFWTILLIKVSVLGVRSFFEQHTRRLELFVNCITAGSIIAEAITGPNTACQLLRMVHVVRLYRAIYLNDSMRLLVETVAVSAPSFMKVFFILFMIFYVFTVLGMVLFGRVRWDGTNSAGINYNANFHRFDLATVTLLRVATVDDWAELMEACAVSEGFDRCDDRVGDCGQPVASRIFFPVMVVILQWIGLNFFTAALMDSFSTTEKDERYAVQKRDVSAFRQQWKSLVDLNTSMSLLNLQQFVSKLGAPLGPELDREYHQELDATTGEMIMKAPRRLGFLDILKFLSVLDLPLYGGTHASQADVFDALIRLYYGVPLPKQVNREVQRLSRRRFEVGQFERFTDLGSPSTSPLAMSMRREGDDGASPRQFVHIRHAAAAAMIQAKWRGARIRRIAKQVVERNKQLMAEHGVTPEAVERAKAERRKRDRLLARPIGTEML